MDEMHANVQTGIPIVRVARELPAAVKDLPDPGLNSARPAPPAAAPALACFKHLI